MSELWCYYRSPTWKYLNARQKIRDEHYCVPESASWSIFQPHSFKGCLIGSQSTKYTIKYFCFDDKHHRWLLEPGSRTRWFFDDFSFVINNFTNKNKSLVQGNFSSQGKFTTGAILRQTIYVTGLVFLKPLMITRFCASTLLGQYWPSTAQVPLTLLAWYQRSATGQY